MVNNIEVTTKNKDNIFARKSVFNNSVEVTIYQEVPNSKDLKKTEVTLDRASAKEFAKAILSMTNAK